MCECHPALPLLVRVVDVQVWFVWSQLKGKRKFVASSQTLFFSPVYCKWKHHLRIKAWHSALMDKPRPRRIFIFPGFKTLHGSELNSRPWLTSLTVSRHILPGLYAAATDSSGTCSFRCWEFRRSKAVTEAWSEKWTSAPHASKMLDKNFFFSLWNKKMVGEPNVTNHQGEEKKIFEDLKVILFSLFCFQSRNFLSFVQ